MPKYYIKSNTLELIYSTNKSPLDAACAAVWELNDNDTLDEYMYVDERGMKDHTSADNKTMVYKTHNVLIQAGWEMEEE